MASNDADPSGPSTATIAGNLADAVDRVSPSVAGIATRRRGVASALAWSADALITTASAIGRADRVSVIRPDGESVVSDVRGSDRGTDLAVIALPAHGLPLPTWRAGAATRIGDVVFACGRDASACAHASFGHVGAVAGPWRTWRGGEVDALVRLDGGLYPGLNGAPVADEHGRVLGVASAWLSRHHGVVLPLQTIERVAAALLAHGRISQGYLGVTVQPVELSTALRTAIGGGVGVGLLVTGIGDDTPAAAAGLLVGDILVGAGDSALTDLEALRATLAAKAVGDRLALRLLRGGHPLTVEIEVRERPSRAAC